MSAIVYQDEMEDEFELPVQTGEPPGVSRDLKGRERYHTQSRHRRQVSRVRNSSGMHRRGQRREI